MDDMDHDQSWVLFLTSRWGEIPGPGLSQSHRMYLDVAISGVGSRK